MERQLMYYTFLISCVLGSYVGCDHEHTLAEAYDIPIDPLSGETNYPWNLRAVPTLSWTTDASKQYAFIMLDVAFNYIHAMYINIQGNDLSTGTVSRPAQIFFLQPTLIFVIPPRCCRLI